jgi:hypothetical protein
MPSLTASHMHAGARWLYHVRAYLCLLQADRALSRGGLAAAKQLFVHPWLHDSRPFAGDDVRLALVDEAVLAAVRMYWRPSACLHRSLVAYKLLRDLGAQPVLKLGVRTVPFAMHAWTVASGRVVGDLDDPVDRRDYVTIEELSGHV